MNRKTFINRSLMTIGGLSLMPHVKPSARDLHGSRAGRPMVISTWDHGMAANEAAWEVLEGGRRYVFHLREDVFWSDGVPVTAGDFEFAWKRVLDPSSGSPNAGLLYDVKGGRAIVEGRFRTGGLQLPDPARSAGESHRYFAALAGTGAGPAHRSLFPPRIQRQ